MRRQEITRYGQLTGEAGDVILLHPFMVGAPSKGHRNLVNV